MGALKLAVVGMGILIVGGTVTLGVLLIGRMSASSAGIASAVLDEPPGTAIMEATAVPDRLVLRLGGGGPDRVVLLDTRTGRVLGRYGLAQ